MNGFLEAIIRAKERESAGIILPDESAFPHRAGKSLAQAVRNQLQNAVIAEIKFRSPSGGVVAPFTDPRIIANEYLNGGATAISVLTDERFFGGRKEYLTAVAGVSPLPVLRKDFIVDEKQLYQSKMLGADAVLLIASIVGERLDEFLELAGNLSMEALVEVRTEPEADLALACGAGIIGINNRDLSTMQISLETTATLSEYLRKEGEDVIIISESGFASEEDLVSMKPFCDGFLIGSSLMPSADRAGTLRRFVCA